MAQTCQRPGGDPGAAESIGKIVAVKASIAGSTEQAATRCAGCACRSRKPHVINGWHDDRPAILCGRCIRSWRVYVRGLACRLEGAL
jgi:hypothetical protein